MHEADQLKVSISQLRLTLCSPMDCSQPESSVHGILQARILEWVAMPSSRRSSPTQGSNPGLPQADSEPPRKPQAAWPITQIQSYITVILFQQSLKRWPKSHPSLRAPLKKLLNASTPLQKNRTGHPVSTHRWVWLNPLWWGQKFLEYVVLRDYHFSFFLRSKPFVEITVLMDWKINTLGEGSQRK